MDVKQGIRFFSMTITVLALLPSCAERAGDRSDTDTTVVRPRLQDERSRTFDSSNVQDFEALIRRQYAREALELPRGEMDSILASLRGADPETIQRAMERRLKAQDTVARRALADRYGIGIDSLNTILSTK